MIFQYFSRQIYFSRTFQESPLYSSTFQACANPDKPLLEAFMHMHLVQKTCVPDDLFYMYYMTFVYCNGGTS